MGYQHDFGKGERIEGTSYRVVGTIGQGGMGSVYEVEHLELGKRFVLKALLPELSGRPDLVARLKNEQRALGRLDHANIVTVTDAGTMASGIPYYVMEKLEGEPFNTVMKRGPLDAGAALTVAAAVCDALAAAHAIGVVHRDIKPPNVFLEFDGTVKLLDFGIAKVASAVDEVITARGVAIGTPRYMSPEQARGEKVDGRADIYAVGLLLFEAMAGRGPFDQRESANDLLLAHLGAEPHRLDRFAAVPAALADYVAALLRKQPEERPGPAERVAADLRSMRDRFGNASSAVQRGTQRLGHAGDVAVSVRPASSLTAPEAPQAARADTAPAATPRTAPLAPVPAAASPFGGSRGPRGTARLVPGTAAGEAPIAGLEPANDGTTQQLEGQEALDASQPPGRYETVRLKELVNDSDLPETRTAVPARPGGQTPPPIEAPPLAPAAPPTAGRLRLAIGGAAIAVVALGAVALALVVMPRPAPGVDVSGAVPAPVDAAAAPAASAEVADGADDPSADGAAPAPDEANAPAPDAARQPAAETPAEVGPRAPVEAGGPAPAAAPVPRGPRSWTRTPEPGPADGGIPVSNPWAKEGRSADATPPGGREKPRPRRKLELPPLDL